MAKQTMSDALADEPMLSLDRVGDRLRAARLAARLELSDIAEKTRVPVRHLQAIESNDFSTLPSFTYATGFVRAYARAVGEDEVALIRELRIELGREQDSWTAVSNDDVADPARIPPKWLAWGAAAVMVVFAGGYGVWRTSLLETSFAEAEPVQTAAKPAHLRAAPAAPKPAVTGPVVLSATDDVWLRVYDRADKVLFEGVLKKGDSFQVPADADTPMIRTGRADQISITVGGAAIAPLGSAEMTIKDVPISATALTARAASTAPTPSPPAIGAAQPRPSSSQTTAPSTTQP